MSRTGITGQFSAANQHHRAGAAPVNRPIVGIVLLILSTWALSCLDASGKWVMAAGVPVLVLSWIRYLVHMLAVFALIVPFKGVRILRSRVPKAQIVRGLFMLLATLLFFTTLSYLPQAEATSINFLAPLIILASAPWLLKEPRYLSRWIAAGVAFVGVLIVVRPSAGLDPIGTVFGFLTACTMAAQFIATRGVASDDPFTTLIWSGAIGIAGLSLAIPFALPAALPVLAALTPLQWTVLLSTGVSGALGHLLQIGAYRNAPASTLAPFIYIQIVSASALGWLVWGDFPSPLSWLGIAIVCGSGVTIGLIEWRRRAHASDRG